MDGTEAARQILAQREIPVAFLTSHAEREMVDRVKDITRYGYVLKASGEFVLLQALDMAFELFYAHRRTRVSEELYRSVATLTGEIITRISYDGGWLFANDRACEFWGMPWDELQTLSYLDLVHQEDRDSTRQVGLHMQQTGDAVFGFRNRQKTPRGWSTVEWNSANIQGPNGKIEGFQATGRDVTERV